MRILHYIPSMEVASGGTTTFSTTLLPELSMSDEIFLVTHRHGEMVSIGGCQVFFAPKFGLTGVSFRRFVRRILAQISPDIVHVNTCWLPTTAVFVELSARYGCKTVLSPHGMLEPWIIRRHYLTRKLPALLLYQKRAIKSVDLVEVTAKSERDNFVKLGFNKSVSIVPLGLDVSSISMKTSWTPRRRILFLSRIHVKKGIDFLVDAISEIKDLVRNYEVLVVGDGDASYITSLRQKIDEAGVADIVKLPGPAYGEEKWQYFRESDFFVLPSHSENFGFVIPEALATGTPVITTKGTPWGDLESNHCGAWIEIGAKPLAEAIARFVKLDAEELEKMGRNGRALVEAKYSASAMAKAQKEVYAEMLRDKL